MMKALKGPAKFKPELTAAHSPFPTFETWPAVLYWFLTLLLHCPTIPRSLRICRNSFGYFMRTILFWLVALACCVVAADSCIAQPVAGKELPAPQIAEPNKDSKTGAIADDSRTAAQLFDEADNYARKKFEEFERQKKPFDKQLEEKIKHE